MRTAATLVVCLLASHLIADEESVSSGAIFKQLDQDGNGQLTRKEAGEDRQSLFDRLLRRGDANDDGQLSSEEFQQAHVADANLNLPLNRLGGPDGHGGQQRQRFEMLDRNKDGKVTRDEVPEQVSQRLRALFERVGKDELTLDDFRQVGRPAKENARRPESAEQRGPKFLQLLDQNHDGRISRSEWSKVSELFQQLDEDEDGELDPRELLGPPPADREMADDGPSRDDRSEMRGRDPQKGVGPGSQFFARLDMNGDGTLSKDEAPPRMRDRFREVDTNGDGSLTPDELRSAFERRMSDRPEGKSGQPNRRPRTPAAE